MYVNDILIYIFIEFKQLFPFAKEHTLKSKSYNDKHYVYSL